MGRAEDYNYSFLRHMIEKIKQTRDVQCPDDEETNNVLMHCTRPVALHTDILAFCGLMFRFLA